MHDPSSQKCKRKILLGFEDALTTPLCPTRWGRGDWDVIGRMIAQ